MYIKRITIQGFKTYKNETIVTNISPNHNVITGRNGSGKSNFFSAIRFVLSDDYSRLSDEEKKSLLHESSTPVMFAFVEIVFDNSDRRIPTARDEVKVKRTIGMRKDDYSLNDMTMSRSDVMSHLSVAGFSKSNPYYIVPQGKVTALTNAKDSERLKLLKDVAGAGVFETKLKDSLKEMNITGQKQEQIKIMLDDIENRLNDLNEEKEEFKEFDHLNRERKILEWTIKDREIKSIEEQIEKIGNDYEDDGNDKLEIMNRVSKREKLIDSNQKNLATTIDEKKLILLEVNQLEKEKSELLSSLANLKVSLSDMEVDMDLNVEISQKEKLEQFQMDIDAKKLELNELEPKISELKHKEETLVKEIYNLSSKQMLLVNKKTQSSRFENESQRNEWINSQIDRLIANKISRETQYNKINSQIEQLHDQLESITTQKMEIDSTDPIDDKIKITDDEYYKIKHFSRKLVDERSEKWREESRKKAIIQQYEEKLTTIEQDLVGTMDGHISKGIDLVNTIAEKFGQKDKVYGCLGELINISEKYRTAAEVVAGNSLFHIVVANEQVAEMIIKEMGKYKGGRITFIPINRIETINVTYPQGNSFVPLYKKISPIGNEAIKKAMWPVVMHIFGRSLVCVNLQVGSEMGREYNLDAITLDGDRIDRNGVLSGGFRDRKASRVEYLHELSKVKGNIFKHKQEIEKLQKEILELNSNIITKNGEISGKKAILDELFNARNNILNEQNKLDNDYIRIKNEELQLEKSRDDINSQILTLKRRIEEYEHQRMTRFTQSTLTENDEKELKEIIENLPILEKERVEIHQELDILELNKSTINSLLSENIIPMYNDLKAKINSSNGSLDTPKNQAIEIKQQIESIENQLQIINNKNGKYVETVSTIEKKINELENLIDELDNEQAADIKDYEDMSKESDKGMVKRTRLRNMQKEKEKVIGELGALPENTKVAFKDETLGTLTNKLSKVNDELKRYSHVNKKALEQFRRFSDQKTELVSKLNELDESKKSIEHLMKILEKRKNEAIIRSFKEVSFAFSKIFERLVPEGKGKLIILKKKNQPANTSISLSQVQPRYDSQQTQLGDENNELQSQSQSQTETDDAGKEMNSYIGISISVSFNSKKDEQQRLEQLSGGQKTLCALALIFAIQHIDPAPFYLFDEIDANLDTQYRTSVANLVYELSRDAQFICTTFRPEQLKVCDKFYGVMFRNKTSTISEIDQDTALGFIEGQSN
ncbi:cohesin subunit [Martiniozyma asiatica (nom. inval.)]|nr:cohesin subunit [Martiniozyma asiatica]